MSTGAAHDISGHGDNGTYVSNDTPVAGALASDPTDQAVQSSSNADNRVMTASDAGLPAGASDRTIEFWCGCVGNSAHTVLSYGSDFSVAVTGNNSPGYGNGLIQVSAGGSSVTLYANYVFQSSWHLIDVTLGLVGGVSTASFYLDGQLQSSAPLTANTALGNGLTLGSGPGNTEFAEYDELAIYPTALSAQAVDEHWTAGASPAGTACAAKPTSAYATAVLTNHPVAYWRLNDFANGFVAYDSSGNCANGAFTSPDLNTAVSGPLASDPSEQGVESLNNHVNQVMIASSAGLPAGSSARTIEFWCQCVNGPAVSPALVLSYGSDFSVAVAPNNSPGGGNGEVVVGAGGASVVLSSPTVFGSGWHLIDVTIGPVGGVSTASFYLDGHFESSAPLTADTILSSGLTLGADPEEFAEYAQLAIYPSALSDVCIAAHFAAAGSSSAAPCPNPPTVVTGQGSDLMPTSATLNGTVNPNGLAVSDCHFEYGTTTSYGSSIPCAQDPGDGSSPAPVSAPVTGLAMSTTYHFRLVAENASQAAMGDDETFKTPTPGPPVVVTGDANPVSVGGATLTGIVTPEGAPITTCRFDYGIGALTQSAPCSPPSGAGFDAAPVSTSLSRLKGQSTYEFRLVATNSYGTTIGGTKTFRTCDSTTAVYAEVVAFGCFSSDARGGVVSSGNVTVNGLELDPHGGEVAIGPIGAKPNVTGAVVHANGSGIIRLGGVIPLPWVGALDWNITDSFTVLPKVNVALFGFRLRGQIIGEVLPDGEMQLTSATSMNVLGDPVTASVGITTHNADSCGTSTSSCAQLVGAEVGVGPADADPLNPNTMGFCSPKKKPPSGYDCVMGQTKSGKSYCCRLTPPGKHPAEINPHLMPFCDPSQAPPIGYRCTAIITQDGKGTRDRLVALRPGIVHLGPIALEGLDFSYDGAERSWGGEATVQLGDMLPGPSVLKSSLANADLTVGATIELSPFQLDEASAALGGTRIPIGPAQLDGASFDLKLHPRFAISGDASLEAGPAKTIAIDGGFAIQQGKTSGVDVKIHGSVGVKTITIGGYVEYDGRNGGEKVLLGGSFTRSWGPVSATLDVGGGISANPFHFQLTGDGSIGAFGLTASGHGIVSDAGVGACASFPFIGDYGFKYFWRNELDFQGCDFGGLYTVSGGATGASVSGRTITLSQHLPREEFAAVGANGAPKVTLTGPHGEFLSTPARPDRITMTKHNLALAVTSSKTTYFVITKPSAGRWTLAPARGAIPPVRYELANPLKPLRLRVRVAGRGLHRSLQWTFSSQRGVSLRFLQNGGTQQTILQTSRGRGRTRFVAAAGPGGTRHIVAVVLIDGFPERQVTIAHFTAQRTSRPAVRQASYRVRGNTIAITWTAVHGANYYEIGVRTSTRLSRYRIPGSARQGKVFVGTDARVRRVTVTTTKAGMSGPAVLAKHVR